MVAEHDSLLVKLFGQNLNHKRLESEARKAQAGEETLTPLDSIDFGSGFPKAHAAVAVSWFFHTSECALHSRLVSIFVARTTAN